MPIATPISPIALSMTLKNITSAVLILIIIISTIYRLRKKKKVDSGMMVYGTQEDLDKYLSNTRTVKSLKKGFKENDLSKHWAYFETLLKKELIIKPTGVDENELSPGKSKIGGRPDLSENIAWLREENGKCLSFIAQINLSEIASFEGAGLLPRKGMLYFFYSANQEAWGFDIKDKGKFKVFFENTDQTKLERKDFPDDLKEHARYKPCKLAFIDSVSLPGWESPLVIDRLDNNESGNYTYLLEEFAPDMNKLLGHSDNIQAPMELECQLVTNGLYCGDGSGYNDPRAEELAKNADDWTLLFQLDSNEKAGMKWGSVGILYFWIKKNDLANKQFDNCWMICQCT
jgi:uncharacterized protein YwqG